MALIDLSAVASFNVESHLTVRESGRKKIETLKTVTLLGRLNECWREIVRMGGPLSVQNVG